jgi:bacillolysin
MSGFNKVIGCAVVAAALSFGSSRLAGQAPVSLEKGRSFAVSGGGLTLSTAVARVDAMLRIGELDIVRTQEDTMMPGRIQERLGQFYKGLPVFGGQVVCQMDGRSLISLTGRLYEGLDLDVNPAISSARANAIALANAGAGANIPGETTLGILPVEAGAYRLVYRMEVRSDWGIREVYIDAVSGQTVRSLNGIHTQRTIGQGTGVHGALKKMSANQTTSTYEAKDALRPAEAVTRDFRGSLSRLNGFLATGLLFNSDTATDSDNIWTDGPTVDAHVYQGWVYDYYFKRFGRRGLDDRNIEIDGIVHPLDRSQATQQPPDIVGTFINNAFYCCSGLMVYGDGDGRIFTHLAAALDVVAHEMTHGVTDFSSQLINQDEPGALNEAFSDIMAAAIEFYYQPVGSGTDKGDWLIGEDVLLVYPGYIRSLNNPHGVLGDPDHYNLRQFIGTTTDDGGVHFNMTIGTHAFYLAVEGGRNRVSGITVAGVGFSSIEKIERIFYRAFALLMAPNSKFSDARAATLQAATDLYGAGSNERSQVEQAWTAVGVN